MIVLFVVELAIGAALFLASYGKYDSKLARVGRENKIRAFLPAGFRAAELLGIKKFMSYRRRLELKISELKGERDAVVFLEIHIATNLVTLLFAIIFITFVGTQIKVDIGYGIFAAIFLAVLAYAMDKQLDDRIKERRRSIQLEFPEFLSKLILLVDAGLTVNGAIHKILRDNKKDNPLYKELAFVLNETGSGKPETEAYESFAKRCRLPEISMFTATLLQNLRKGSAELVPILRLQANTCWENRKNIARKLGEEASTKLIIPMIMIFIVILIMLMTPAVMQLNI